MDGDTTTDLLIGAVVPLLIAAINRTYWSPRIKGAVALVTCLVIATGVALLRVDSVSWANWREAVIAITGTAFILYHTFWKPSGIAPTVEAVTTPDATADA